jgi:hypothetical protein
LREFVYSRLWCADAAEKGEEVSSAFYCCVVLFFAFSLIFRLCVQCLFLLCFSHLHLPFVDNALQSIRGMEELLLQLVADKQYKLIPPLRRRLDDAIVAQSELNFLRFPPPKPDPTFGAASPVGSATAFVTVI